MCVCWSLFFLRYRFLLVIGYVSLFSNSMLSCETDVSLKHSMNSRWELKFDSLSVHDWMAANPIVPFIATALYVIGILYGRRVHFVTRPAWNWRKSLAIWNFALSAFSFIGVIRVLPNVIHSVYSYTWKEMFCMDPESMHGSGSTGAWIVLFVLSKFP